jgi:hypothetical protein
MRTINVTFTNQEHQDLIQRKGALSWHDWIIKLNEEAAKHGDTQRY